MTRSELALLVQAHAVAYTAIAAPELRKSPFAAAFALHEAASVEMPLFAPACWRFLKDLRDCHGRFPEVAEAGRRFRDAVAEAMAFTPCDAKRVDIHG